MKQLVFSLLLAAFALAGSETASAGTYCSATTSEGMWAMKFGPESMAYNCGVVRRSLRANASTPISRHSRGYYRPFGVNRVLISCGFYYANVITSTGVYALQNAVNTARSSSMSHCVFAVNGW